MQKMITSLIFLLMIVTPIFANEPGPGFFIEWGHDLDNIPTKYIDNSTQSFDEYENYKTEYININVHYTFQFWGKIQVIPFGEIKTWYLMNINDPINGKPFCDIYTVGATIQWEGLSFSIDHYCAHPVYSGNGMWQVKDYRMGGNVNEIKLKYSFN